MKIFLMDQEIYKIAVHIQRNIIKNLQTLVASVLLKLIYKNTPAMKTIITCITLAVLAGFTTGIISMIYKISVWMAPLIL
jgi:hypothetical protein